MKPSALYEDAAPSVVITHSHLDEPQETVMTAVSAGHDADTVASMTAAYVGALSGPRARSGRSPSTTRSGLRRGRPSLDSTE